jgi:hypothetical protein
METPMLHAFTWLPSQYRWAVLATLLAGTVAFAYKLKTQGEPLVTADAPRGILTYEFAWSRSGVELILRSWSSLKDVARRQLRLDFGFLVFYPLLLSLACAMMAESPHNGTAVVGVFISWAVLGSGPLDAVENLALLRMLDAGASGGLARLAGWCAGIKFLLVFSCLGYLMLQGAGILVGKMRAVLQK